MRSTLRPSFTQTQIFDACLKRMHGGPRKDRIIANKSKVERASVTYAAAGSSGTINGISQAKSSVLKDGATAEDMQWFYEQRLVKGKSGRIYYDKLKTANRGTRCALCNVKQATTLDHHLPQSSYPVFTVTPDNLLPACLPCNKIKLASVDLSLNTYFDDLGSGPWLKATIVPIRPLVIDFDIVAQPSWSASLTAKALSHFELFGLREVYSFEANRHFSGVRGILLYTLRTQGADGLRSYLTDQADSWQGGEPYSPEAAFYRAACSSPWFYGGGFG